MLEFFPLDKDVKIIKEYIEKSKISFCDLSLGTKFLWRDEFRVDYAIFNDTLILKESCRAYENAFYYPMGKDVNGALLEIENYTKIKHIPLVFCCIDNDTCEELSKRYFEIEINNDRNWSDYIYTAETFKTYSGKKLSGQRNHVNKFKRRYPDYSFKVMESGDVNEVKIFLEAFGKGKEFSIWTEKSEFLKLSEYVEKASNLNQLGGILKVNDKIVGVSFGEVVKNTLIVHVEKANREFEGAYAMLATCFANAFSNGVKFINREEDCGDMGLRISKLQYHPVEIKQKNVVRVKTLIEKLFEDIYIKTERLTLTVIKEQDKENYFRLYTDDDLNKYWGYEYRDDLGTDTATPEYFFNFQKKMKETLEEFSFAVRVNGLMVGELVYHNFDYDGGLEIGYRFLREHQRKGYAFEGATALIEYAKNTLCAKTIYTRCDKRNIPSFNLITKLGFKVYKESETHYFFSQKLN